jgi:hypothetical protein
MDPEESADIPNTRGEQRRDAYHPHWFILTAYRADTTDPVEVELSLDQWWDLAPMQYTLKLELSRQQPRRPSAIAEGPTALSIPRGHIEWKNGQNMVVITAHRYQTQEPMTVEMTLAQWMMLKPVRYIVMEHLDRWRDREPARWR